MHSGAKVTGMSFGDGGDQVRGPRQSQRVQKTANDRDDLPFQPQGLQGFINRSLIEAPSRDQDVPAARITGGSDLAAAQRMPPSHRANETVTKQRVRANLGTRCLSDHACFQVDGSVAKRRAVSVCFLHEAEPHSRSFLADARKQSRPEVLHEAFAGAQRERADELFEVERLGRAQNRFSVLHKLTDTLAEFECSRRGNETAPGPDQQRVTGRRTQSR